MSNVTVSTTTSNISVAQTNLSVSVNESNNVITVTQPVSNVTVNTDALANIIVSESGILSNSQIRSAVSVTNSGYDLGNLTYNNSTGVFTFVGINNSQIRGLLSNTSPITYNSSTGEIGLEQTLDDLTLKKYQETIVDNGNISGNVSFDINNGTIHKGTIVGNISGITLANISSGGQATLILQQDSIGTFDLTGSFPDFEFVSDFKTLDTNANAVNVINIVYDGSKFYAALSDFNANITETANITTTGNISGSYILGNGSQLTGLTSASNTAAKAFIEANGLDASANLSTTANISGAYLLGNGSAITGLLTTQVAEGTNLYFTTARANSAITAYTGALTNLTGNVTTTGIITGGSAVTDTHSLTGNLNVTGNVEVSGNLNYRNVTDLQVQNTELIMNANANSDATVSFIVNRPTAGANTVLRWNETDDKWQFSNDGSNYENVSGLTNAQAQAFIQSNGLSMTANVDSTKSLNFTYPDTVLEGIKIISDTSSSGLTVLDVTSARSGDAGPQQFYRKATGSIASPGAISTRDYVKREKYFGHDGTDYLETMGIQVYQDTDVGSVSTNVVPLAYEIYTEQGGDVNHGFNQSIVRFDADRNIIFNDTGTRTFGNGQGNANIKMDGSINTVSNVTASGNIEGGNVIASTNFVGPGTGISGMSTSQVSEGTNLYYTDTRSRAAVSVTQASASGAGTLAYNNSTGVFTYTPPDLSSFGTSNLTNAQAQAFIQTNGLSMTANIDTTKQINVDIPDSITEVLKVEAETPSSGTTILDITSARSADGGPQNKYQKATGTIASPGAIGTRDYVQRNLYYGHDGTDYINTFGTMVYQDSDVGGVSTGNVPLAYEIFTNLAGDSNDGFINSIVRFDANRNIIFNDTGTRTFGNGQGNANITADGTINTVSAINATGNITGNYLLGNGSQLTGVTSTSFGTVTVSGQTNIQASQGNAILDIAATGDITLATSGNTLTIGGSGGSYGNTQVNNFLTNAGVSSTFKINTDDVNAITSIHASNTATNGNNFARQKSRGTVASPLTLADGDTVALDRFFGYDGNSYEEAFLANVYVDGSVSDGTMPLAMKFAPFSGTANPPAALDMRANSEIKFAGGNADITAAGALTATSFTGNGAGITGLTTSIVTEGSNEYFTTARANTAIDDYAGGLPNLTSGITMTSSSTFDPLTMQQDSSSSIGMDVTFKKSRGGGVLNDNDRIVEWNYEAHDGSDYIRPLEAHVYKDSYASLTSGTGIMPLAWEIHGKTGGNTSTSGTVSMLRVTNDRNIVFNDSGSRGFGTGAGNANITADGTFNTVAGINATGNITGNYILGNGSALTGITTSTDSFGTFTVSGQTNVQASQANASVEFAAGAGIQITTSANTVTISGSGGSYGNTEVSNYLEANVQTANVNLQGNINVNKDIHTANAIFTDNIFSETPGGTFTLTSLRCTDLGIGSPTFFFPDTGGNQTGAVLTTNANGVGSFNIGISTESESAVEMIDSRIYRDGSNGTALDFYKAGGNIASPTAPGSNDYIVQQDCFIHDGTDFQNAAGYHVFQDGDSGSVSTNVTPVSHEFYVKKDQTGFQKSVMKLTADQTIIFNDTGVRSFGNYKGTANISADGSFHTAGDITIDGRLKLPNYTTTEVNALSSPAAGDVVFNTTENTICFYNGSAWHKVTSTAL